jgi:uncharacterized membrane protein YsdA (DUF1294 family)
MEEKCLIFCLTSGLFGHLQGNEWVPGRRRRASFNLALAIVLVVFNIFPLLF